MAMVSMMNLSKTSYPWIQAKSQGACESRKTSHKQVSLQASGDKATFEAIQEKGWTDVTETVCKPWLLCNEATLLKL